jgi:hypothetical protein
MENRVAIIQGPASIEVVKNAHQTYEYSIRPYSIEVLDAPRSENVEVYVTFHNMPKMKVPFRTFKNKKKLETAFRKNDYRNINAKSILSHETILRC